MVRTAALVFFAAATSAPGQRFDLICTGTTETYFAGQTTNEPYSAHYRIDLAARKWCEAGCGSVRAIADIQEAFLELEAPSDSATADGREHYLWTISRTDGREKVIYQREGPNFYSQITEASCTPAPFSGFPILKKQF